MALASALGGGGGDGDGPNIGLALLWSGLAVSVARIVLTVVNYSSRVRLRTDPLELTGPPSCMKSIHTIDFRGVRLRWGNHRRRFYGWSSSGLCSEARSLAGSLAVRRRRMMWSAGASDEEGNEASNGSRCGMTRGVQINPEIVVDQHITQAGDLAQRNVGSWGAHSTRSPSVAQEPTMDLSTFVGDGRCRAIRRVQETDRGPR